MIAYIVNGLIYYFGWFLCVYLGGVGYSLLSCGVALALAGSQLGVIFRRNRTQFYQDLYLTLMVLALGIVMEMGFMWSGLLIYKDSLAFFPPLWLMALYPLFAVTLNHSLRWISCLPFLPFILGGIGAPLSYRAGEALHAVAIKAPELTSLIEIGVVWGVYLSIVLYLNRKIFT